MAEGECQKCASWPSRVRWTIAKVIGCALLVSFFSAAVFMRYESRIMPYLTAKACRYTRIPTDHFDPVEDFLPFMEVHASHSGCAMMDILSRQMKAARTTGSNMLHICRARLRQSWNPLEYARQAYEKLEKARREIPGTRPFWQAP